MPLTLQPGSLLQTTDLVRAVTHIAALPEVTIRIIQTVDNPRSSAHDLHRIISHDPVLAARVLKVVNSAFYGLPGQIASLERAIVLLGLNGVKNIAVAASLGQMFRGGALGGGYMVKDLWTHSIAVSVAAYELAKNLRLELPDEVFLAGLIHDLGLLLSLQLLPDRLRTVCDAAKTSDQTFCQLESKIIGLDHQQVGQALAAHWKFPRSCQVAAGSHHRPGDVQDSAQKISEIVYVADTLCREYGFGFDLTTLHQSVDADQLTALHIDPAAVPSREKLQPLVQEAVATLG